MIITYDEVVSDRQNSSLKACVHTQPKKLIKSRSGDFHQCSHTPAAHFIPWIFFLEVRGLCYSTRNKPSACHRRERTNRNLCFPLKKPYIPTDL